MRPVYLISKTPYEGVIHIPILQTRFFTPVIDFSRYDGLIVTSKQILKALEPYPKEWRSLPIIAVSESTAGVFREEGCTIAASADGYGEQIGTIVEEQFPQKRWLYLRPETVATSWAEKAREKGIRIDEAVMYQTQCNNEAMEVDISESGVLIFTSPSAIRCYMQKHVILSSQKVVVIGKTTQNALPSGIFSSLSLTTSVESAVELAHQIAAAR